MARAGNLIIVGTYEEFVIGYALVPDEDAEEKLCLHRTFACRSHIGSVRCLTAGGTLLASGGIDENIRLYNMETQCEAGMLTNHTGTVTTMAFAENGSFLLSGSDDGSISIVRAGSWIEVKKWPSAHSGSAVTCLSVHPSGKLALSVGANNRIGTWNLVKGTRGIMRDMSKSCHKNWGVSEVQWSPNGTLYAVGLGSHAQIFSLEKGKDVHNITCSNRLTAMCFISDNLILLGEEGGEASIYNVEGSESREIVRFQAHDKRVKCAKSLGKVEDGSRNAFHFATAGGTGCIRLWELDDMNVEMLCETSTGCRITCMEVVDIDEVAKSSKNTEDSRTNSIQTKKKTVSALKESKGESSGVSPRNGIRKNKGHVSVFEEKDDCETVFSSSKKSLRKQHSSNNDPQSKKRKVSNCSVPKDGSSHKKHCKVKSVNAGKWTVTSQ